MNKYVVKLNNLFEEIIETRFNDADIFITYKPKLDGYMVFVETHHTQERVMAFDCVDEVRKIRKYSLDV